MDAAMELSGVMLMHRCKVCGKGFSCGRSLGGHMRSHISFGEAVAVGEVDGDGGGDDEASGRCSNGVVGYGLRENPKKTRRLSEFADDGEEEEEEGGDGGDGDGDLRACRVCGKLFSSWRSLFGHVRRRHASAGGRDHDDEAEEVVAAPAAVTVIAAPPRRRRRSMRVAAPAPAPPAFGGFEKEQEDVALGLLMLSRDTGLWHSPPPQAKQQPRPYGYNSDEDSALLHHNHNSGDVAVAKRTKRRRASYHHAPPKSISPKHQQRQRRAAAPAPGAKGTRYECPGCGKVFGSYQALGGHRASHKRINTNCSAPKLSPLAAAAPEPSSTETYASLSTLSPDSVAASGIGDDDSKAKKSAAAEEKFGGACSDDGELYAEMEMDQQHSPGAGFLDLNYPPASSSEVA